MTQTTVVVNRDWFEHLLNCLANQKYLTEMKFEDQKNAQEVIDAAWVEGMTILQYDENHV